MSVVALLFLVPVVILLSLGTDLLLCVCDSCASPGERSSSFLASVPNKPCPGGNSKIMFREMVISSRPLNPGLSVSMKKNQPSQGPF